MAHSSSFEWNGGFPALSSFLSQRPAQLISCPSLAKRSHVETNLGHYDFDRQAAYAGYADQKFDGCAERFEVGIDLLIHADDRRFESVEMVKMQPKQEAMVRGRGPAEPLARSSAEARRRLSAKQASVNRSVCPAISASIMRRPETPETSLITKSNLMLASSSVV